LVNIEKADAPLGATIRNRDGSIIIARIVVGGAAEQSGLLHEEDEILEINSIPVRGKTINDICDMLANLTGIVSFLIIPNMNLDANKLQQHNQQLANVEHENIRKSGQILHIRALFTYVPQEDLYIPCKELGLSFNKGDILHVIMQDDEDWWQAYRDDDKDRSLAGLIPSLNFQERRCAQMQALIGDSFMNRKKRDKGFCIKAMPKNRRRRMFDGMLQNGNPLNEEIVTYEQVTLHKPDVHHKRPIVLIGPHNIGRHELRKRLMQSNPGLFEVAVPHTTRTPRKDEIDGKDYHFLPRHIFEADIKQGRFIEHGEYEKNLYGTSREAIRKVIENSKICVLNLYPQALKSLRSSDLMPYVIYIGPPNLAKLKELKNSLNEAYRVSSLFFQVYRVY
jgi:MAGUK p55 subfamily protein 5